MAKYATKEIFTPAMPATFTYVDRDKIEAGLVDALMTPGKQIIIYGHSGSGKTTLRKKKLDETYENTIVTSCTKGMSFNQVLLNAFDQLDRFYISEKTKTKTTKISSELTALYSTIKAEISQGFSESQKRVLPVQLTAQRLAQFIGETNSCWVIEDFHKITENEKIHLAQTMKVFMDMAAEYPELKIIAIGAVGTAREVVHYDNDMQNRVAEIYVPLMTFMELEQIISKGEQLLNISFDRDVINRCTTYSSGLASVCHQLCLSMCLTEGIYETCKEKVNFERIDLKNAIEKFLEQKSDTLKDAFEKATKLNRNTKYDDPKIILKAMIESSIEEQGIFEIHRRIKIDNPNYPLSNLRKYLKELAGDNRGEVLRFNENSNKYFFTNPFIKTFIQMSYDNELNIVNPNITHSELVALMTAKNDIEDLYLDLDDDEY